VEPLVGGLFKAPQTFGQASEMEKETDAHNAEMDRPIGGEEQTGSNPLGLNQGGPKE
jgi:hypothetical protein